MQVLETARGAVFAPARFSAVPFSLGALVAHRKSLAGGGAEDLILMNANRTKTGATGAQCQSVARHSQV